MFRGPVNSQMGRQVSNVKQILTACALFAADKGAGRFPNGHYDAKTGEMTSEIPAESAEACFQDLFDAGIMEMELLFWLPQNEMQCETAKPDEDGILEPGENYFDNVSGLSEVKKSTLPPVGLEIPIIILFLLLNCVTVAGNIGIMKTKNGRPIMN